MCLSHNFENLKKTRVQRSLVSYVLGYSQSCINVHHFCQVQQELEVRELTLAWLSSILLQISGELLSRRGRISIKHREIADFQDVIVFAVGRLSMSNRYNKEAWIYFFDCLTFLHEGRYHFIRSWLSDNEFLPVFPVSKDTSINDVLALV